MDIKDVAKAAELARDLFTTRRALRSTSTKFGKLSVVVFSDLDHNPTVDFELSREEWQSALITHECKLVLDLMEVGVYDAYEPKPDPNPDPKSAV